MSSSFQNFLLNDVFNMTPAELYMPPLPRDVLQLQVNDLLISSKVDDISMIADLELKEHQLLYKEQLQYTPDNYGTNGFYLSSVNPQSVVEILAENKDNINNLLCTTSSNFRSSLFNTVEVNKRIAKRNSDEGRYLYTTTTTTTALLIKITVYT